RCADERRRSERGEALYNLSERERLLFRKRDDLLCIGAEAALRQVQDVGERCIEIMRREVMPSERAAELRQGDVERIALIVRRSLDLAGLLIRVAHEDAGAGQDQHVLGVASGGSSAT